MNKEWCNKKYISVYISIGILLLSICILIYSTLSWFYLQKTIEAVSRIETPSKLAILGKDQTAIEAIDLSGIDLSKGERKAEFLFCICGTSNIDAYDLELAYTTNNNFIYTVYKAGTSSNNYPKGDKLSFEEIDNTNKYTTNITYGDYANEHVQSMADPEYWICSSISSDDNSSSNNMEYSFADYYYLEVSWGEDALISLNGKETDMVYLMAATSN